LTETFLHPPFDEPLLLARVLAGEPAPDLRSATLPGHACRSDHAGVRVALVPEAGSRVAGRLVALTEAGRARLDFAMAALGAAPAAVTAVTAEAATGGIAARAYLFPEGAAPGCDRGPEGGEGRLRLAETLDEVMGHFGRRPASEMPGLLGGIAIRALARARGARETVPSRLGSGLGADAVEPVARDEAYARYFGVEEHRLRHRRFDGSMSEVLERAVFTSGDAVTVVPFDPRRGTVLLIEQFRTGVFARRDPHPWCLEAVAGRCDRIEPPEETARREAREEAGLDLGRIERIAGYYPSPGTMAEYITAFVGEADLGRAGGTHGLAEEHEDIRALVVPLEAALGALAAGEVRNAPLMLSLYWLEANAARLRAEWRSPA
jgi:nudix-type nucleoside diphosphatase (YffH/AdpP family)